MHVRALLAFLALASIALSALPGPAAALDPPNPVPDAVAGFAALPFVAVDVPTALAWGPGMPDPDLYVTTLAGNVERVNVLWTESGPVALGSARHASGFSQPLGLVWVEGTLFVADSHANPATGRTDGRIWRVDGEDRTVAVDGLPNGRHNANHLRLGPDGLLYVANGNPNDNGIQGGAADVFPYSGAVLRFDPRAVAATPAILRWTDENGAKIPEHAIAGHPVNAPFAALVEAYAWGFRNPFGVAFGPDGALYTAHNGADAPSSQDALYRVTKTGTDFGFPFCFDVGEPGAVGSGISKEANPLFGEHDCSAAPRATALLGWHVCATGLDLPTTGPAAFGGEYAHSVYVGECGPFFAEPHEKGFSTHDTGHKVVRVALGPDGEAVAVSDFLTGLALPTDVLFGPDGALYVADAGGVIRVAPVVEPPAGATVLVEAAAFSFAPAALTVPAGTTVTWEGRLFPHTVTTSATSLDALDGLANDAANTDADTDTFREGLPQGASVSHTFTKPGRYPYFCEVHYRFGMVGEIVVV